MISITVIVVLAARCLDSADMLAEMSFAIAMILVFHRITVVTAASSTSAASELLKSKKNQLNIYKSFNCSFE